MACQLRRRLPKAAVAPGSDFPRALRGCPLASPCCGWLIRPRRVFGLLLVLLLTRFFPQASPRVMEKFVQRRHAAGQKTAVLSDTSLSGHVPVQKRQKVASGSALAAANGGPARLPKLYCDLDGVLADFDTASRALLKGSDPRGVAPARLWGAVNRREHFYRDLPWMPDGPELWNFINPFDPVIITGLPSGMREYHAADKREWCRVHLGPDVPVICCMARDKVRYAESPGCVLIDDRAEKAEAQWVAAGGIFVHHTGTASTLARLKELGYGSVPPSASLPSP